MTAEDLLLELRRRGVQLFIRGGCLRFRARQGSYTPELRRLVDEHRPALLALLGAREEGGRAHCAQRTHSEEACARQEKPVELWDAARADAVLAAINARLDRALRYDADTEARRTVLETYRGAVARLHRNRDPLLWESLKSIEALLARWRVRG
jgi:hypothetical protein